MKYVILNNGCSFSADWSLSRHGKIHGWASYCKNLPGQVYNIARGGSGIESMRVFRFINEVNTNLTHHYKLYTFQENFINKSLDKWSKAGQPSSLPVNLKLTHFIYQVPSLARKVNVDVEMNKATWKNIVKLIFTEGMECIEHHSKEALKIIHENVIILRKKWPDIKIMFLRYTHSGGHHELAYEFSKKFHKTNLSDYCKNNNITYIYEDNFHTDWFYKNKLTNDIRHPNEAGAKLISDKIKEYL